MQYISTPSMVEPANSKQASSNSATTLSAPTWLNSSSHLQITSSEHPMRCSHSAQSSRDLPQTATGQNTLMTSKHSPLSSQPSAPASQSRTRVRKPMAYLVLICPLLGQPSICANRKIAGNH